MRTLLVLGGADGSLSTYRTARALGYRTVCVDWSATAPGVALADEQLPVSTRDPDAILAALASAGWTADIAGVLAPASDIALPTLVELTTRLGLPCHLSAEAVRASVDKRYFREVCDELGLPSYWWVAVPPGVDPVAAVRGLDLPVVVKPADAQSGRGLTRCADPAELAGAVAEAQRYSYCGTAVVEQEVVGAHLSVECVVDGGRTVLLAATRRSVAPAPLATTTAHLMPAPLSEHSHALLVATVDKLCARLGYVRGPLNLDAVLGQDGEPRLIEMGARTGGNGLDELVRHCYGVDVIVAAVQAAVGGPIDATVHPPRPVLWHVLGATRGGELRGVTGLEVARAQPGVRELAIVVRPGQQVRPYRTVADKLGYAVFTGSSESELRAAADQLLATVAFDIVDPAATVGP